MEEIIKFIGGTSVALLIISFLIRSLVQHLLGKDVESFKTQLKYEAEHGNHLLMQKFSLYKEVAEPIIDFIVAAQHATTLEKSDLELFDKSRLSTTALLAMFAPKNVFDNYNNLIDYLYDAVEGKQAWGFDTFRSRALLFLSEVRRDIGLYNDNLEYTGTRLTMLGLPC